MKNLNYRELKDLAPESMLEIVKDAISYRDNLLYECYSFISACNEDSPTPRTKDLNSKLSNFFQKSLISTHTQYLKQQGFKKC